MTREEQRLQVVQACLDHQQHLAAVAKQEMDSCQQQSNEYGPNKDRYDAYRTKLMRQRDMYAKQLSNANACIRVLQELIRQQPHTIAEHGAVVITDKQNFFLSVGAGKFLVSFRSPMEVPQRTFFAISAQTPIYVAIQGLEVGDNFVFNNLTQTIREIY